MQTEKKLNDNNISKSVTEGKIRNFLVRQKDKLKHGQFTCPLCKGVFTGISALGSHLKKHCT